MRAYLTDDNHADRFRLLPHVTRIARTLGSIVLLIVTVLLSGPLAPSDAAPPENADPALRDWFQSLKQPGTSISCCSISDCRPVEYRLAKDGYDALVNGHWVRVPAGKVLHHTANPTAQGILCQQPFGGSILCFVPASES